ncbi:hypothetical protein W911_02800 [Hyphomicrobium nitrativorans NL23]|uniref:Uncharacterized protein n=1 Tax=Hyphomicrobium nitrativorans NL23 TaxID=1029756 RepID=V5SH99_9HYPH|nr:hypothetical protein [Hyphomicrobium nitrativorans]AHB49867.1 hypothetical protein W911_02800 [Hyphomicrobium nitrativorans NL23]
MTRRRTLPALFCLAIAALLPAGGTHANDPALKPGLDPGGTAVAILADGFDYTNAQLAKALARDGEGEAIAWDAVDQDHRPYATDGLGTPAAIAATAQGGVRIVQVRVDAKDTASLARGIAFAVQTPARIVLALLPESEAASGSVLAAAAEKFETTLFVGSAPELTVDDNARSDGIANLLLVEAGEDGLAAAEALAEMLGCDKRSEGKSGAELKRLFLDRGKETPAPECKPKSTGQAEKP